MNISSLPSNGRVPFPQKAQKDLVGLVFFVALATLLMINITSFFVLQETERQDQKVEQTESIIASFNTILSHLKDAQINRQNYLLTQKPAYLQRYIRSTSALKEQFENLEPLLETDSREHQLFQQLQTLSARKIAILQKAIDAKLEIQANRVTVETELMDSIYTVIAEVKTSIDQRSKKYLQAELFATQATSIS